MMRTLLFALFLDGLLMTPTTGSSIKMDFLPFANVRTDPIIAPNELSEHIHTFYGATVARPETTYNDLRNAYGGTGTAAENMSLYWHPTIYQVLPDGTHKLAEMYFMSAYYIWTPGEAKAFPDGFKMIAFVPESQAADWFPQEPTEELETEMVFPDCWDGVNLDSANHMDHVAYSSPGEDVSQPCPSTHPVRIPLISLFVRLRNYQGGPHVFSDGTTRMHADYFSGWNESELQNVLDNCDNGSFESAPDAFCETFLTFKDAGPNGEKTPDPCGTIDSELIKIQAFQPPPLDTSTITEEVIDMVKELPFGQGVGVLKFGPTRTLPPAPTLAPVQVNCEDNEGEEGGGEEGEGGGESEGGEGDEGGEESEGGEGEEEGEEEEGEEEEGEEEEGEDEADAESRNGDECSDDEDFEFFINSRLGIRDCEWLSNRNLRGQTICDEFPEVARKCKDACGLC